jgi:hypothetical protein
VIASVPVLPAASRAVTVTTFAPDWSAIEAIVQDVVPEAVPEPPRSFAHVTCVTPTLSEAVPPSETAEEAVAYVDEDVGEVIVAVGAVVSGAGALWAVTTTEYIEVSGVPLWRFPPSVTVPAGKSIEKRWRVPSARRSSPTSVQPASQLGSGTLRGSWATYTVTFRSTTKLKRLLPVEDLSSLAVRM